MKRIGNVMEPKIVMDFPVEYLSLQRPIKAGIYPFYDFGAFEEELRGLKNTLPVVRISMKRWQIKERL